MKNENKKKQAARLSTESVMTPTPAQNNISYSSADKINSSIDKPISEAHKDYDTDLARDNLENDITAADLQDL
jgi:hypothetical protein